MPNEEITTFFGADISNLKKAMQDARREIKVTNSEFKASSAGMDDWSKSSDGLSQKLSQLRSNLKNQKTVLAALEEQHRQVSEEQGKHSKGAQELEIKINNQKATIAKTSREIDGYEDALDQVTKAEKVAAKTGKDITEVLEDTGDEAKDAGDGFTVFKGAIATFAGNALSSLASGIKDAASNILNLSSETREYRNELSKLETAFTTAGFTTEAATKTYKDLYAVLGEEDQSVEAANHLAKLCDSEKELSDWTNIATGVYATFGASLPIEGLTEAANESAKVGTVCSNLADALSWAGVSEDKFNESLEKCSSEQERQQLITKTLNGLYDDASKKYQETNKSVMDANRANSDYTDTLATMGEKVEPATTALKTGFNQLLGELLKLVEGVDMEAFVAKIQQGFAILTNDVLPAVKKGFQWIIDNKAILLAAITGIAGGFAAFKAVGMITTAIGAVKKLGSAMAILKAAMTALGGPVTIIITIIAALVAGFITLWNTSDSFRNFWINLWEGIKRACSAAKDWIANVIQAIGKFFTETIPNALNVAIEWFKQLPTKVSTWLKNTLNKVTQWSTNMKNKATETASNFIKKIIDYVQQLPSKVWTWLVNTINKVNTWRTNMLNKAKDIASNFLNRIIDYVKQLPSKIWTWLVNVINTVNTWRTNMLNKAKDIASNFLNRIIDYIKQLPGKIWTQLSNVISKVNTWRTNMLNKAKDTASNFINRIIDYVKQLPGKIGTQLSNALSKVGTWASNLATKGADAGRRLLDSIVNKVKEIPGKMLSIGGDIVSGLWDGIGDKVRWLKDKISGFVGDVTGWLKDKFKIGSPSKLMADEIGKWLPEGIAVGINKNAKSVLSSVKDLTASTIGAAHDGLETNSSTRGGVVNNFHQVINSPKQLSRLEIYRQSKNLLNYAGGF